MATQLESVKTNSIEEDPRRLCQSKGSFQDLPRLNWSLRDKTSCGGSHQQECSLIIKFKGTVQKYRYVSSHEKSRTNPDGDQPFTS